jgi:hypothetical protein
MAKRLTASEKWDDPWFCDLDANYKLAWLYLLDKCNHAGIWSPNFKLMEFHLGFQPRIGGFGGRVVALKDGKWFIPKFIDFQYGELNPENRAHLSVIHILKKEGASKPLVSPLQGDKDKDKDKDKDNSPSSSLERGAGETIPDDLKANEVDIKNWLEYKRQKGQRYKPKGLEALWRAIRAIPENKRKESIENCMANNWAGLFEKTGGNNGHKGIDGKLHAEIGGVERPDSKYAGIVKTIRTGR